MSRDAEKCKRFDAGGCPAVSGTIYVCPGCSRPTFDVYRHGHDENGVAWKRTPHDESRRRKATG